LSWLNQTLDELANLPSIGYLPGAAAAAEPMAIAAFAFLGAQRIDPAQRLVDALAKMQQPSGQVSVRAGEESPGWPTSLAVVSWNAFMQATNSRDHAGHAARGIDWLLANRGKSIERTDAFGHNPELVGWAYAEQTHSWVEPTAFAVLALKSAGRGHESAAREGVSVLIDRQLPGGGLNYGNTYVLGQLLRSHVQPTGISLLALAGETDHSGSIAKTIAWLSRNIGPESTPLSLAWAILGLRAHGKEPSQADEWLASAVMRVQSRDRSPHKLALLALATRAWPK
jgi:hypothetical protein